MEVKCEEDACHFGHFILFDFIVEVKCEEDAFMVLFHNHKQSLLSVATCQRGMVMEPMCSVVTVDDTHTSTRLPFDVKHSTVQPIFICIAEGPEQCN